MFQNIKCLLLVFKFACLKEENNWITKHEKIIEEKDGSVLNKRWRDCTS